MTVIEHEVNSPALVPMDFHGDQILTFKAGGEPYVAMRRIVENLSMSWGTQRNKLERQERILWEDLIVMDFAEVRLVHTHLRVRAAAS